MTRLWIDDLRNPQGGEDWFIVRTADDALAFLDKQSDFYYGPSRYSEWVGMDTRVHTRVDHYQRLDEISFDHDLGGTDTTRDVMLWLADANPDLWPHEVTIHTANPVGREWLLGTANRYAPKDVTISILSHAEGVTND